MRPPIVFVSWLFLSTASFAADPPLAPGMPSVAPTTDWAPNEVVTVHMKVSGPALWHIKKGEAEIWILGTVGAMPKDLTWNSDHLADVIKGAKVVLTPPRASTGFFSGVWFFLTNRSLLSQPDGQTLSGTLPPDLKVRFAAIAGNSRDRLEDDVPIVASQRLENGFNEHQKLSSVEPLETIEKIARRNDVPVKRIADYDALGLIKELLHLPQAAQQNCLREVLTDIEQRSVHARPAAEAWSIGDVKAIKANYSVGVFEKCGKQTASFNKFYERAVADYLKAIQTALATPGKTVMITDVGSLLRSTGVVEALHKEGVTIEGPAE